MFRGISSLLGLFFVTAGVFAVASLTKTPAVPAWRRLALPVRRSARATWRWTRPRFTLALRSTDAPLYLSP